MAPTPRRHGTKYDLFPASSGGGQQLCEQYMACDGQSRIRGIEDAITTIQAANKTWGVAIAGILSGATLFAIPFLLWVSSAVSAHETAINVVRTEVQGQEARVKDMAADIKTILAELRKKP